MKIAILYICTGKYTVFWKGFYESAEKYLLSKHQKTYFVFTDADEFCCEEKENVKKIYQERLGWPFDTLMRFSTFKKAENDLVSFDYIFFFNANMLFVDYVEEELLDYEADTGLLAVKHPGYYNVKSSEFPYDRNEKSTAFIPHGQGSYYFMGGLNGGKTEDYLKLINSLERNIKIDLDNDVIAVWHDESQLNKYLLDKKVKILSPAYGFPEGWKLPFEPKIIIRDKNKWGGHSLLRNMTHIKENNGIFNIIKKLLKKIYHKAKSVRT